MTSNIRKAHTNVNYSVFTEISNSVQKTLILLMMGAKLNKLLCNYLSGTAKFKMNK